MQTIRVVESCGCGATCAVEDWWPKTIQATLAEFRTAHQACRSQAAKAGASGV